MKKLLAFTSIAILTAGVANAKTAEDHYGDAMFEQHDQIEALFDELDLDNDGVVLNTEYNALQGLMTERIPVEFDAMDLDGNKVITREEAGEYSTLTPTQRNAMLIEKNNERNTTVVKTERHYHVYDTEIDTDGAYELNN